MEGTGSAFFQIKTANNTDGGVYFRTGSTNAGAVSYLHTDNSMSFRVNSTPKLKITSTGVVWAQDGKIQLGTTSGQDNYIYSTNAAGIIYQADENGHTFQTYDSSWQDRLEIKDDGHVVINQGLGVGGQDPGGSTLRVHGSIYASLGGNTSWQKLQLEGSNNTAGDALSMNNWGDAEGDYWMIGVNQTMNQSGNYSKTNSGKRTSFVTIDGRMGRVYLGGASTSGNPTEHFYTNWNGSIYADAEYGSPRAMYPCRAWANLSGDSNPATIRVSRGLSGVSDLGTGDYRFTFSSAMTDANYSALCSSAGDGGWSMAPHIYSHSDMTTTTVRFSINAVNVSGQNYDRDIFCMAIFR